MKALVRDHEVITEPFSKWIEDHMDWMTKERPNGDGYKLINDYQPPEISGLP